MAIPGLSSYGGFYQSYKVSEIAKVSARDVKNFQPGVGSEIKDKDAYETRSAVGDRQPDLRSKYADLENISLTFQANDTFASIGRDVSLDNLDMMRAISDMQKDKVLEQYQYFVPPQEINQVISQSEDGIVIQK